MSKIDYQALRAKAEKATCGEWSLEYGEERFDAGDALIHREVVGYLPICRIEGAHPESGFDEDFQMEQQANAEFIAAFNPKVALALLDERERNQQYIKSRDQENEDIALTVGRLRVELEGKDSKIANLTAERDALREGEMATLGIATHGPQLISTSNWSRSAKFLLADLWSSTLTICARSWKPQRSALQS